MNELVFLGTGGGRYSCITQARATAGLRIELAELNLHIDPGPGTIVRYKEQKINPQTNDAILVSHCHTDHFSDSGIMIEAMTRGGVKKRGWLIGSESVVNGIKGFKSPLIDYHRNLPEHVKMMKPGSSLKINNLEIVAAEARHTDPSTIGFVFYTKLGKVSYTSDTEFFEDLTRIHKNARFLVVNVMRPGADRIPGHLCIEDVKALAEKIKPELLLITHFGMRMLRMNPFGQAKSVEEDTGVKTIAVTDAQRVSLERQKNLTEY